MNKLRHALMGSIAAFAIVAAGGAALAQESQEHGMQGKAPPAATQQPNHTMGQSDRSVGGQGASAEKSNRNAQTQPDRQTQTDRRVGQSGDDKAGAKGSAERRDDTARDNRMSRDSRPADTKNGAAQNHASKTDATRTNAATARDQDRGNLKGLQGNASGVNVQLNDRQKTQIRTTVIQARNAPRVDHVNFDISVGTAIPRGGVRIVPVPATLVQIEPTWRGFQYFVYEQEVVIVNPRDMTIVAVLVV